MAYYKTKSGSFINITDGAFRNISQEERSKLEAGTSPYTESQYSKVADIIKFEAGGTTTPTTSTGGAVSSQEEADILAATKAKQESLKPREPDPTTLFDYYQAKGEAFPDWQQRKSIYEEAGLGTAGSYFGTGEQNRALLASFLSRDEQERLKQEGVKTTPTPTIPITTPTTIKTPTTDVKSTTAGTTSQATTIDTSAVDKTIEDYRKNMSKAFEDYFGEQSKYLEELKAQPSALENLQKYREEQGLPQLEKQIAGIDQTILDTEGLLANIDEDIRTRTEGLPVTEAAARRLTAMEQAPLSKQLSEQIRGRQRLAAGYEAKRGVVSDYLTAQQTDLERQRDIATIKLGLGKERLEFEAERLEFGITESRKKAEQEVKDAQIAFSQAITLDKRRIAQSQLELAQRKLALEKQEIEEPGVTDTGTSTQQIAAGFASRMQEASLIFDELSDQIASAGIFDIIKWRALPNWAKPAWFQRQEQAERNFVNAILRKESGAAISEEEFENARKQYFPQAGDSPEVLEQKKANRETVMNSMIGAAGLAWQEAADVGDVEPNQADIDYINSLNL